ncbi:MAG: HAD-IIIA family hydrolase [Candidatus Omnitrophica bacterium]|nr:HAD-IIIA family hydrolase [Candidatus Omnitrophota bacterium]
MNPGVFLERNGILNLVRVERQHQVNPLTLGEFIVNPAAIAPLRRLKKAGFVVLATTNQPGLSLDYLPRHELDRMHGLLLRRLPLDAIYTCPHDLSDDCPCCKPKPGLLFEAAHQWRLDLDRCFVISDKWQDALAAHNAGCTSMLVRSPWIGNGHHDFVLSTLDEVVDRILQIHVNSYAMNSAA